MTDMYDIVKKLFGISKPNSEIQLSFIDDENDNITFSSDRELDAAFALVNSEGWKTLKIYVETDRKEGAVSVSTEKKEKSASENHVAVTQKAVKAKPNGKFLPQENSQGSIPEAYSKPGSAVFDAESKECDSPESSRKIPEKGSGEKVEQSVPLRATSGGAYLYKDGTVEFGMGGEAVLLPDGQTVSCTLSYRGFPSVAAAGTLLTECKLVGAIRSLKVIPTAEKVLEMMSIQLHTTERESLSGITDVHSPLENDGKLVTSFVVLPIWTKGP